MRSEFRTTKNSLSSFLTIVFLLIISGCGENKKDQFLLACDNVEVSKESAFSLQVHELPPIPITPQEFKERPSTSLLEANNSWYILETSLKGQNFTIYNISEGTIEKNSSLDYPPIDIGQTTFKSMDSIYFQLPERSQVMWFDSSGVVRKKYDFSGFSTDWFIEEAFLGLFNHLPQGQLLFKNQKEVLFLINPFDFWLYPDRSKIKLVAEVDLEAEKLNANFASQENYLTTSEVSLPESHTFPSMTTKDGSLYLSYPYDHTIYEYDLTSHSIRSTICMASRFIEKLPDPLLKNSETQASINFQLSSPHYGPIYYHEKAGVFSRLVFHARDLHESDGSLNLNNCDNGYSLILFDQEMRLINETELDSKALWEKALPVSDGFVVSGKCDTYKGEDYFRYNMHYELVQD